MTISCLLGAARGWPKKRDIQTNLGSKFTTLRDHHHAHHIHYRPNIDSDKTFYDYEDIYLT